MTTKQKEVSCRKCGNIVCSNKNEWNIESWRKGRRRQSGPRKVITLTHDCVKNCTMRNGNLMKSTSVDGVTFIKCKKCKKTLAQYVRKKYLLDGETCDIKGPKTKKMRVSKYLELKLLNDHNDETNPVVKTKGKKKKPDKMVDEDDEEEEDKINEKEKENEVEHDKIESERQTERIRQRLQSEYDQKLQKEKRKFKAKKQKEQERIEHLQRKLSETELERDRLKSESMSSKNQEKTMEEKMKIMEKENKKLQEENEKLKQKWDVQVRFFNREIKKLKRIISSQNNELSTPPKNEVNEVREVKEEEEEEEEKKEDRVFLVKEVSILTKLSSKEFNETTMKKLMDESHEIRKRNRYLYHKRKNAIEWIRRIMIQRYYASHYLQKMNNNECVYAVGSFVHGTCIPESDIDIGVFNLSDSNAYDLQSFLNKHHFQDCQFITWGRENQVKLIKGIKYHFSKNRKDVIDIDIGIDNHDAHRKSLKYRRTGEEFPTFMYASQLLKRMSHGQLGRHSDKIQFAFPGGNIYENMCREWILKLVNNHKSFKKSEWYKIPERKRVVMILNGCCEYVESLVFERARKPFLFDSSIGEVQHFYFKNRKIFDEFTLFFKRLKERLLFGVKTKE